MGRMSYLKRNARCNLVRLRKGIGQLFIPSFTDDKSRTTPASFRMPLRVGACSLVAAILVCYSGDTRSAWAREDATTQTYEFTADQLEVEVDTKTKPPTDVVVRNGNDKDDDLEFSVEVSSQGRSPDTQTSTTPENDSPEAQSTLSFLSDPIDLTLRPKAGGGEVSKDDKECDSETGTYKSIRPGDKTTNLDQAKTTVFINYTGSEDLLKKLRFDADVTEKAIGEEAEDPSNPAIAVCPQAAAKDKLYPTEAPGVASIGISLNAESPATKPWANWWSPKYFWKYISTPDIPETWSRLSGQLVVYADNQKAGEDIDPAVLSVQLFSPASGYWNWLSQITLIAVIFALSMMPLLVEGVGLYREGDNIRRFASTYSWTALVIVVGYFLLERIGDVTNRLPIWSLVLLWLLISVLITAMRLLSRAENSADGTTTNLGKILLQPLDFDFKTEWVSTVTTAGAILGTVVSAGILPEVTYLMPKAQYTALNVVFGLTVAVAVTAYNLVPRSVVLLLASALVLGAAIGELLTVIFLLSEMMYQDIITLWPVRYLQGILVIAAILLPPIAAWKGIKEVCKKNPRSGEQSVPQGPIQPNLPAGNIAALLSYAQGIGVPADDVARLRAAIEADADVDSAPAETGQFGPAVSAWLGRESANSLRDGSMGATDQGVQFLARAIAQFYLARAVAQYYGLNADL
jgi:hypothetical protein